MSISYTCAAARGTRESDHCGGIFPAPVTTATVMTANLSGADLTTVAHTVKAVQSRVIANPS